MYAFAARMAVDMKLFQSIAASTSGISATSIAAETGHSEELISKAYHFSFSSFTNISTAVVQSELSEFYLPLVLSQKWMRTSGRRILSLK